MRNDDIEYVFDLERSVRSMEIEIKALEMEIKRKDEIIAEMAEQLAPPTFMGEPVTLLPALPSSDAAHRTTSR